MSARPAILGVALACLAAGGCLSSPGQGGGDGGPGGRDGGAAGGDAGTSELCGTTRALRDDFDGDELDTWRWYSELGVIDDGAVELTVGPDELSSFAMLSSQASYRVAGGDVQVELYFDAFAEESLVMLWLRGASTSVGMQLDGPLVKLVVDDGDGFSFPDSASFSPSQVWWRLWEVEGRVHWGLSHDGESWEDLGDVAWDEPLATVEVWLDRDDATTSIVDVRSVNVRAPAEGSCKASSFTDEFDDLSRWDQRLDPPCVISYDGALAFATNEAANCTVVGRERFDLRGSAMAVDMSLVGDCEPSPVLSLAHRNGFTDVACGKDKDDAVLLTAYTEEGDFSPIDYDDAEHRYLRLRHDPEQHAVLWETHPSGAGAWTQFHVSPVSDGDMEAIEVRLGIDGAPSPDAANGAVFDKLNLTPE